MKLKILQMVILLLINKFNASLISLSDVFILKIIYIGGKFYMKEAVIVIDMVNDFVTGKFKNEYAQQIIPATQQLLTAAHYHHVPVIYCCDAHLPHDFELKVWGEHCMDGTWGAQIIPELKPQSQDYVLKKRTYCAFFQTGLDSLLRELNVKNIILTGVVTNICVINSAAAGFFNGYHVIVPPETTASTTTDKTQSSLKYMQHNYATEITAVKDIIKQWQ